MNYLLLILIPLLLSCESKPQLTCSEQFNRDPAAKAKWDEAQKLYDSYKVTDKVIILEAPFEGLEGEIMALSKPQGSCYNGFTVMYPRATVYVPYLEKIGKQAQWLDLRELKKK